MMEEKKVLYYILSVLAMILKNSCRRHQNAPTDQSQGASSVPAAAEVSLKIQKELKVARHLLLLQVCFFHHVSSNVCINLDATLTQIL